MWVSDVGSLSSLEGPVPSVGVWAGTIQPGHRVTGTQLLGPDSKAAWSPRQRPGAARVGIQDSGGPIHIQQPPHRGSQSQDGGL